jgi:Carboxypeptidase regulatory-like domain
MFGIRKSKNHFDNFPMHGRLWIFSLIAAMFALCQISVLAQSTGTIRTSVVDPAGNVVVGADVSATQAETNVTFTAKTNSDGYAVFTSIPPGSYEITVTSPSFGSLKTTGVLLETGQERLVPVKLQAASVKETVQVTADAVALQTEDASQGAVIPGSSIVELPLNQRRYTDLTLLVPGATSPLGNVNGAATAQDVIVNGLRIRANDFLLDGTDNNSPAHIGGLSSNVINPPPDALTQFHLETSNFDAEYGLAVGAVIDVSIKSGTNQLHGSAWEFNRNTIFAAPSWANNHFDQPKSELTYNQPGFTLGGPILKNKLFIFGDYQYFGSNSSATTISTVPLPQNLTGDFSNLTSPLINPAGGFFPGNIIPPNDIDPLAQKTVSLLPAPNAPSTPNSSGRPVNNYIGNTPTSVHTNQMDVRGDYDLNAANRFFARYSYSDNQTSTPSVYPKSPLGYYPNGQGSTHLGNNQIALGWTKVFSTAVLNDVRFVRSGQAEDVTNSNQGTGVSSGFGFQGVDPSLDKNLPNFFINNYLGPSYTTIGPGYWNPQYHHPWSYDISDNISIVKGKHFFKFGAEYKIKQDNWVDIEFQTENFTFAGTYTGDPLADAILGLPYSIGAQTQMVAHERQRILGGYAQDQWKILPNVTIDAGLRYDYYTPYYGVEGHNNVRFDFPSQQLVMAPGGQSLVLGARYSGNQYAMNPDFTNWSPRIGIAYQISPRIAIHSHFGLFYDAQDVHGTTPDALLNPPNTYQRSQNAVGNTPPVEVSQPFPTGFLDIASIPSSSLNLEVYPANSYSSRVLQWNVALQYQLSKDSTVEVAYVGNSGSRFDTIFAGNNAPWGLDGTVQSNRNYPNWGAMDTLEKNGSSDYNAMQAKFEKRSNTWTNITSFTYASAIDNTESTTVPGGNPVEVVNLTSAGPQPDLHRERAFASDFTRLHFTSATTWNLPFGRGARFGSNAGTGLNQLIGGWQFSYILTAQSGLPVNVTMDFVGADPTTGQAYSFYQQQGGGALRPDRVGNSNPNSHISPNKDPNSFLNATAFALQPLNTPGDAARNVAWGPTYIDLDSSLQKDFIVKEKYNFMIRVEAFNILNHTNFLAPNSDWSGGAFGQITGANPNRQLQMAARFRF